MISYLIYKMPSDKDEQVVTSSDDVVKNVSFDDSKKKKGKKNENEKKIEEASTEESSTDEEDEDYEEDDDDEQEDDEQEDEEDDDDEAEGITDVGLYNVLGNFLMDEEGNSIGISLSNIAKELAKLNHLVKKASKSS